MSNDDERTPETWCFECTHCGAGFRLHFNACGDDCPLCDEGRLAE